MSQSGLTSPLRLIQFTRNSEETHPDIHLLEHFTVIKTQTSSGFLVRELGHDLMKLRGTHKGLLLKQPGKDNDRNIDRPVQE